MYLLLLKMATSISSNVGYMCASVLTTTAFCVQSEQSRVFWRHISFESLHDLLRSTDLWEVSGKCTIRNKSFCTLITVLKETTRIEPGSSTASSYGISYVEHAWKGLSLFIHFLGSPIFPPVHRPHFLNTVLGKFFYGLQLQTAPQNFRPVYTTGWKGYVWW